MIVMLQAELAKLRRPLVPAVVLLGALLAVTALVQQQEHGQKAKQAVQFWYAYVKPLEHGSISTNTQNGKIVTCSFRTTYPAGSFCQTYLAQQIQGDEADLLTSEQTVTAASLTQNPVGVGTMAGGVMASMLGFMLVMILAAGHVGGEWAERTLRTMLIRQPKRWRILAVKSLSLWLTSVAILATVWAVLAVASAYYHWEKPLDPVGIAGLSATNGLIILGRCLVVLAVYSLVGTALATLGRGVIGTLIGGVAVGAGSLMAGYDFATASQHEFVFWVTGFMGSLDPRMIGTDEFWLTTFKAYSAVPTLDGGLLGLAVLAALAAGIAIARFCGTEVTL